MNIDWKIVVDVAQFILTGGVYVYIHLTKKNDATNKRLEQHENETRLWKEQHGTRIATLEGAMEVWPTHQDMDNLHNRITQLGRETSEQTGTLNGMKHQLNLIQEHLMRAGK